MTITVIGVAAIAFSFLAAKSSYYILKFLAGAAWVATGLVWTYVAPSNTPAGGAPHTIIMLLFYIFGIAFMFYPFWRTNGETLGKIVPFWRSEEDDDSIARRLPTRSERNIAYRARVSNAIKGRR